MDLALVISTGRRPSIRQGLDGAHPHSLWELFHNLSEFVQHLSGDSGVASPILEFLREVKGHPRGPRWTPRGPKWNSPKKGHVFRDFRTAPEAPRGPPEATDEDEDEDDELEEEEEESSSSSSGMCSIFRRLERRSVQGLVTLQAKR